MANINELAKLAIDSYKGVCTKYSAKEAQDTLREALKEMNGGSTKLNWKKLLRGEYNEIYALVEVILQNTVPEGLRDDDFFNALVEYRNVAEGDKNLFVVEDGNLFVFDEVANGTQALRRQRLGGYNEITIPTTMKMARIYEELSRIMAGRADFNHLIDVATESLRRQMLNDAYNLWANATANDLGGAQYFPTSTGGYDEDDLLEVIAHVEAAAGGKAATISGTKAALKPLMASIKGNEGKDIIDNQGYVGKFYGSNVIMIPQRHQADGVRFVFPDDELTIIAGDSKPIKFVTEGDGVLFQRPATDNADLTQELVYGEKYGVGLVLGTNTGIGRYSMA